MTPMTYSRRLTSAGRKSRMPRAGCVLVPNVFCFLPYVFTRASFREGACALRAAGGQVRFLNKCFRSQLNSLLPPGHRVSTRHSVLRTHHSSVITHHSSPITFVKRNICHVVLPKQIEPCHFLVGQRTLHSGRNTHN